METTKTKQIAWFQWLRIFAAAAVVLMHTEGGWWPAISSDSRDWMVLTAYDGLVRWPVQVFLMITGAIFLPRRTELGTVLKRYLPRMAAAMVFWSAVYTAYAWYSGTREDLLLLFVTGHYHLWYLPFLCGLYLVLPFLQRIVSERKLAWQLFAVSAVVGLLIPWLADVAVLLAPGSGPVVRSLENSANFTFFLDLLAVPVLGHLLRQTELSPRSRRLLYGLGVLSWLLTAPATVWATARMGTQSTVFCDLTAPNNLCTAAAVFVFAKYHLSRLPKAVEEMAACSFGVYLIHPLILELLQAQGIHCLAWDPVWAVPAVAAAVFVLSLTAAAVLRRLPVVGKILV